MPPIVAMPCAVALTVYLFAVIPFVCVLLYYSGRASNQVVNLYEDVLLYYLPKSDLYYIRTIKQLTMTPKFIIIEGKFGHRNEVRTEAPALREKLKIPRTFKDQDELAITEFLKNHTETHTNNRKRGEENGDN